MPNRCTGVFLRGLSEMPRDNRFQHQPYPTTPGDAVEFHQLEVLDPFEGINAGLHERHRIARVVLVHGTFMGEDPFGISSTLNAVAESLPLAGAALRQLSERLRERTQPLVTRLARDLGNYTEEFRVRFQQLVGDDPQVEFPQAAWSSENHHLARADLAVSLLEQLLLRPLPEDQRVLFWGHSHAGNAFAILSNLLANHPPSIERFFAAVQDRVPARWQAVHTALRRSESPHPLARQVLFAAFGTPVRYGWDSAGCSALLHVNFHRVYNPHEPAIARPVYPPWNVSDILSGAWGDWVQAFAIAGTDTTSIPAAKTNALLSEILESGLSPIDPATLSTALRFTPAGRFRDLCARWQQGTRCHADGLNLLVDYTPSGDRTFPGIPIESAVMGHGVATSVRWLPAHLRLIEQALNGKN